MTRPRPSAPAAGTRVLVMNHRGERLDACLDLLRRTRLRDSESELAETTALADSRAHVADHDPDLVVLAPLILRGDSVEIEMLDRLQEGRAPVPCLIVLPGPEALEHFEDCAAAFRDFVVAPVDPREFALRADQALRTRARYLALRRLAEDLEGQVSIDFKTGLLSERHLRNVLSVEFKRAQRNRTPLAMLLIDLDDFKRINDSTEYAFGDRVLRQVAEVLRHNVRETDFPARFGGDEFCVLLPNTGASEAVQTAIRIRQAISTTVLHDPDHDYTVRATVSIGIDAHDGGTGGSPEELLRRANRALREAKRRGKNQVWLHSGEAEAAREDAADAADESGA